MTLEEKKILVEEAKEYFRKHNPRLGKLIDEIDEMLAILKVQMEMWQIEYECRKARSSRFAFDATRDLSSLTPP